MTKDQSAIAKAVDDVSKAMTDTASKNIQTAMYTKENNVDRMEAGQKKTQIEWNWNGWNYGFVWDVIKNLRNERELTLYINLQ